MISALILSLVLSGVSVDITPKYQKLVDAGTSVDYKEARRNQCVALVNAAFKGTDFKVTKILWATVVVSETEDAAIVLLTNNGAQVGLFLFYRNGSWSTLEEDFK